MPTIYEVSELAGVSLATVSRVMNGSAKVSEKSKKKVRDAMEELGYRPNSVAISLASKRSNCIGILVAELDGAFFGSMMTGIEKTLRQYQKHVVITAGHSNDADEREGVEFLKSRNCDALVIHAEQLSDEYLIELSKGDTPIVVMNRQIDAIAEKCVSLDNVKGGYIATRHVLEKGHRQLVNIAGPKFKNDAMERIVGFQQAVNEAGIDFDENRVFEGDYLQESGAAAIDHFVMSGIEFTGVVCGNDQMAIGAMARLREYKRLPSKDVAVIGFDDVSFAACTYPTLTTINYPIKLMGQQAAKLVLKDVYKIGVKDIRQIYEPTLMERNSVKRLRSK
ncbi:LacI family DNA-binding transcriptional regulator [Agaribacter marinus]|uniref:Transcriptional regulator n=1 Tax=Agaribacter marinus TaxID=1431249 RepID=A0AA37WKF8_9ALTE|nr:substrate-binding domain-containing protein [Agaribacter marinus]GLR71539.1 transcriptional regulator [Agaribacter marinus]